MNIYKIYFTENELVWTTEFFEHCLYKMNGTKEPTEDDKKRTLRFESILKALKLAKKSGR